MPSNTHEQQFLTALRDIFIGASVEGDSGYINLMKIKSRYYTQGVFPHLQTDIDKACKPFEPAFREELFDKLHDFFKAYFSESGSIYFRRTPGHQNVYDKVYTDDRDVILFWKTHMLYYVKTDRLFTSLEVTVDDILFFFDVSRMELKRSNEKRNLVYAFQSIRPGRLNLAVGYSERGRKTKSEDILKAARDGGLTVSEDSLERACRIFEKQSEVDYFINKDAGAFLREQFDLWLYQYVFSGQSAFNEIRLRQLQAIKEIAFKIIDFIAQFEDELARVWNKPRFVLNSHYVLTLDKITDPALLGKILAHPNFPAQQQEWRGLGMTDETFKLEMLSEKDLTGAPLHPRFQFLPIDTKHFPDLELEILALFEDLDAALDGWLIHSENYQALNTLLPKFRERVDAIYIDPPYNTGPSEINYVNNYKDSSWLSLLKDRVDLCIGYLHTEAALAIAIDDYLLVRLSEILDEGYTNYERIVVVVNHHPQGSGGNNISRTHEYMLYLVPQGKDLIRGKEKTAGVEYRSFMLSGPGENKSRKGRPNSFYALIVDPIQKKIVRIEPPPIGENYDTQPTPEGFVRWYPIGSTGREQVWCRSYTSALKCLEKGEIFLSDNSSVKIAINVSGKRTLLFSNWVDSKYNAGPHGTQLLRDLFGENESFLYPKSQHLVADAVDSIVWQQDEPIILDFFAGSGTTAHAVMNLNRTDGGKRKYILVEMGEHFNTVILPRVKKVAFSDQWREGKAQPGQGLSHFVKYYDLEQYEDTLRRARYEDSELLAGSDPYTSYVFLRDLKLLDAISIDFTHDRLDLDLAALYPGIDLAETLSCVSGKWIKRITPETVEFADGTSASLTHPDWSLIKPLVWW